MYDDRERIDRVAIQQDIEFDEFGRLISAELIVERCITARRGFESVEVIINNFAER